MAPSVLCMDDLFAGSLDCNAKDMQIAKATNIVITDPCGFPGVRAIEHRERDSRLIAWEEG